MIDIHSHILSDLDDGAQSLSDSIAMARTAVQDGISEVISTPHHANGRYSNHSETVLRGVEELKLQLEKLQIPLKIWPGHEIRFNKNLIEELQDNTALTLNQSRYVLVEFPSDHVPKQITEYIHELAIIGKIAIIAHPERNLELMRDPDQLYQLIKLGALSQVTASSLNGSLSSKVQNLAYKFCEANLVHFIASDAHNSTNRPFGLTTAYEKLTGRFGPDLAAHYQMNAKAVVDNHSITLRQPKQKKRSLLDRVFNGFHSG